MPQTSHAATVHLDTHHHVGAIDRRVFGGFLEHLGRAVYEGVYDPGNPLSDDRGFRRDVLDALRPLNFSVMRYPGGNYVSAADWRHGVGPRELRPRRPDYAWQSVETNQFGTDEFMAWAKELGTEPMMAVNLGTAGAREAGELVEYCNLAGGTHYSDLRRQNGRADPYGVKLWCLGNEMDGPWQAGHVPAEVYAQRAFQASFLMKGLDRSIETVIAGSSGRGMPTYMEWDRKILDYCWDTIDYIGAHDYATNYRDDAASFLAYGVDVDQTLRDYAAVIDYVAAAKKSKKQIYVSFDEWNVWYKARTPRDMMGNWSEAPHLLEEQYNLEDALVVAQYLAAFVRRADVVKIGCLAQVVNVIAPLMTSKTGVLAQSIYWPFRWFSQLCPGRTSLTPVVVAPTYAAGDRGEVPALDAAAAYDGAAGSLALFLSNRTAEPLAVAVDVSDQRVAGVTSGLVMAGPDLKAANSFDRPDAVRPSPIAPTVGDGRLRVTLPPTSFACVVARVVAR